MSWGLLVLFGLGAISGWLFAKVWGQKELIEKCDNCRWFMVYGSPEPRHDLNFVGAKTGRVDVFRPNPAHTVDMDGLILTESGGGPQAIGDDGRSKGLCQISRAAWDDVNVWCKEHHGQYMSYNTWWDNPEVNRNRADVYVNEVIPNKYFKAWGIPDSTYARIAAYKMGPQKFRELYEEKEEQWVYCAPASVNRDIRKYQDFMTTKAQRARENEDTRVAADTIQQAME